MARSINYLSIGKLYHVQSKQCVDVRTKHAQLTTTNPAYASSVHNAIKALHEEQPNPADLLTIGVIGKAYYVDNAGKESVIHDLIIKAPKETGERDELEFLQELTPRIEYQTLGARRMVIGGFMSRSFKYFVLMSFDHLYIGTDDYKQTMLEFYRNYND